MPVPCVDGTERLYLSFDAAASTGALGQILAAVDAFVPWYSSVHRGARRTGRSGVAHPIANACK